MGVGYNNRPYLFSLTVSSAVGRTWCSFFLKGDDDWFLETKWMAWRSDFYHFRNLQLRALYLPYKSAVCVCVNLQLDNNLDINFVLVMCLCESRAMTIGF